ncbi:hypothetical protein [Ferrimonas senticii]|uniref:hypothetical protein n=1 Tax=Ferrimonas senticii TaxID=394566 RepID=UPI0003F6CCE4|nr:hypothetical protein [Ferrimonas senticii]
MAKVNISVDQQLLQRLMADGQLCVAQLQALDPQSKQVLWQLCLECSGDLKSATNRPLTEQQPLHFKPYQQCHPILDS